jgi:pimeloyl-ACP methyl ester carboxylesterase
MRPWKKPLAGRLDEHVFTSKLLEGNLRGDPHERPLWIYVPPGYDASKERLPSVYMLQGWTGQIDMWRNRSALRPNPIELFDAVFESRTASPAIVVFVDAWTSWGGSQFLDSPALGAYHSYLCNEIVPFVDAHYRTDADRDHRAVAGKSSGGYGAMVTAMMRPDLFGALATHCGDGLFELCYAPGFPKSVRSLRDEYAGSFDRFLADFQTRPAFSKPSDFNLMSDWSMASCYSADPDGTVRLPYNPETGEMIPQIWERWLAMDPIRMARTKLDVLASMRAIYIDSGKKDEWFLDLAAQAFYREARSAGAKEVFLELYDAGHMQVEYRYPIALRWLLERIA